MLDEANSALVSESDLLVTKAIHQWGKSQNKTVITIAHRLTSASDADLIVVMSNGLIVSCGKHEELIETSNDYRNLVNAGQQITDDIV